MTRLMNVLFAGVMVRMVVELSEFGLLATSSVPLALDALAHLLLAFGFLGLGRWLSPSAGLLAPVAAAIGAVGHLFLVWPPLTIVRSYTPDLLLLIRESSVTTAAAVALAVATALLGVATLRAADLPRWVAAVLVAGPSISLVVLFLGGPLWVANLGNLAMAFGLFRICLQAVPFRGEADEAATTG